MAQTPILYAELTDKIINGFYHVYNTLGYGFLEKVYRNAMKVWLERAGLRVEKEVPIAVYFEGEVVGDYFADLIVERKVILEIKTAEGLCKANENQVLNYLRATNIEVGLVLNFGLKPEFRRKLFTNDRKPNLCGVKSFT